MGFHELGHDLVLTGELGLELLDPGLLSIFDGLGLAAIGEGEVAVLEELFEPVVKLVGVDVVFITQVGNGDLVDEVALEDGNLVLIGEMTALPVRVVGAVHVKPPYRLC